MVTALRTRARIRKYFERVADEFDITSCIRFNSEVVSLLWEDTRWKLETNDGYVGEFPYVFAATGVLHHPNVPEFDGVEDFGGAVFHSARWDHSVPLDGKKSGHRHRFNRGTDHLCARRQCERVRALQRSAQWVLPAPNPEFSDEERAEFRSNPEAHEEYVRELRHHNVSANIVCCHRTQFD